MREVEPFVDGTIPCDWLLVAPPEAPMRLAIEAVRNSGWPVLVVDEEERLLGVVGIDELLDALRRRAEPRSQEDRLGIKTVNKA